MYKVLIYIVFYCISFAQLYGQDSTKIVSHSKPDSSARNQKPVIKAKPADEPCCKTIEQFKNDVYKIDSTQFSRKYNKKPVKFIADTLFMMFNRGIAYKIIPGDIIPKNKSTRSATIKPSAVVRVQVTDSNDISHVPLEYTISLDSVDNFIFHPNNIKDSSQNIGATLIANNKGLLILLKDPKEHSNLAENNLASDNASSQSNTVVLLVITGLSLIIGTATYLYGRTMLKKAELLSEKNSALSSIPTSATTSVPSKENRSQRKVGVVTNIPEQPASDQSIQNIPLNIVQEEDRTIAQNSTVYVKDIIENPADPEDVSIKPATAANVVSGIARETKKYFLAEIMATSGPRKKYMGEPNADKDLGEDVCGFVVEDDALLMYLLDGTSDLNTLRNPENNQEYFSSRLLAQSVANKLRVAFTTNRKEALEATMLQAIQEVRTEWLLNVNNLPQQEKNLLKEKIETKGFQECASTILMGQLSINGQITVYRSGDSKMFMFQGAGENKLIFENTTLTQKNDESNDRIFFRLKLNADKEFEILCNKPRYEIIEREQVSTVIVFSDGIGTLTEESMQQQYASNPEETRKEVMYQTQGTADDKSICFISIKEN